LEKATHVVEVSALENPRLLGEALIALADARDMVSHIRANFTEIAPYASVGKAVTTPSMSVSLRNALDIVRQIKHVPLVDFCDVLRRYGWIKLTPCDSTHRPTKAAVDAGLVERVYYNENRGYKPAITPTGIELLKHAFTTGKFDILRI
jgi:hypothetical protein